jgi:hypothetical protein
MAKRFFKASSRFSAVEKASGDVSDRPPETVLAAVPIAGKCDSCSNPVCLDVFCPNPLCPNPDCPNADCPNAFCPNPDCPNVFCPNPCCPNGICPNPCCPNGSFPNPCCPNGSFPNPLKNSIKINFYINTRQTA